MILPDTIPQYYGGEEDSESWGEFLYKTGKGSIEGPEMLPGAINALGNRLGKWHRPIEEFDKAVGIALPVTCPFASLQEFIDLLSTFGFLPIAMKAQERPFAERMEYDALWSHRKQVPSHRLIHDAAHHCFHRWSAEEFLRLADEVASDGANYNSQDAVAVMLFWAIAWASVQEAEESGSSNER